MFLRNFFPKQVATVSPFNSLHRFFAAINIEKLRNIGISAHIDSGKTTFTERVLYYGGRINSIHEVRGSDNVGATMDFMELEKEKGITIQSAATHLAWKDHHINIIDTPGHVDFTIEVERALRVLDGAILIICAASGVQPQTLTVDRQMKRYNVPRIVFINKLDRMGANPFEAVKQLRERLGLNVALVQIPIGLESDFEGLIDLIERKAFKFEGVQGNIITEIEIPEKLKEDVEKKRAELVESLANVDPEIEEIYLEEKEPTPEQLHCSIRKTVIERKFSPVFMGSAYKNKGVQLALDGVCKYLPNPHEKANFMYELDEENQKNIEVPMEINPKKPFIALAFKLEENRFGQLTYIRVYQGKLKRGDFIYNVNMKKKQKVSRMVKVHANELEEIEEVEAGDIFAIFGMECSSGDTFIQGELQTSKYFLSKMFVPDPVMSFTIRPTKNEYNTKFQKALSKFQREDPTLRVNVDQETEDIIISGMGELHLEIYAERMRREYEIDVVLGKPDVNYRETIGAKTHFDYLHKKQTGGAGQYARVIGYIEQVSKIEDENETPEFKNEFQNKVVGQTIPNEYVVAIEKAFYEACEKVRQT